MTLGVTATDPFLFSLSNMGGLGALVGCSVREMVGLSQEALADEAELHRTYISLLERGLRTPSILVVQKLARAMGTTRTSLIRELEG